MIEAKRLSARGKARGEYPSAGAVSTGDVPNELSAIHPRTIQWPSVTESGYPRESRC